MLIALILIIGIVLIMKMIIKIIKIIIKKYLFIAGVSQVFK